MSAVKKREIGLSVEKIRSIRMFPAIFFFDEGLFQGLPAVVEARLDETQGCRAVAEKRHYEIGRRERYNVYFSEESITQLEKGRSVEYPVSDIGTIIFHNGHKRADL